MSETKTIARPYANACFEIAKTNEQTGDWLLFLEAASMVVQNDAILSIIKSPNSDKEALTTKIFSIANAAAGIEASAHRMNFLSLLAQNARLETLPEIKQQFELMKQTSEKTVEATITAASPINEESLESIRAALESKLNQTVTIVTKTDESLIGGAKIQIGDNMIDSSVRSQIDQLGRVLTN